MVNNKEILKLDNISLIVSDLDGTLLSSDFIIPKENINYINKLRENNMIFSFATGRHDLMCLSYIKDLNLNTPIISSNGALIRNPITKEIIYKETISSLTSLKIMEFCEMNNLDYMVYNLDKIHFTKTSKRINKFKSYNLLAKKNNVEQINLLFYDNNHKDLSQDGVLKILIFSDNLHAIELAEEFLSQFSDISYILSEKNALDVSHKNVSKGNALKKLASHLNIKKENICSFGDFTNDISLFENSKISFAMKNSPEIVKQSATYTTNSNDQSGVAVAIKNYIL